MALKKIKTKEINLSGKSMTIFKCEETFMDIKNALAKNNDICLRINKLDDIDLTGIQLLMSLKKTTASQGKNISIDLTLNEDQRQLLERSGIQEISLKSKVLNNE